ncbi:M15 family metallopeptidase [Streptomyces hygroscopicus]|uniref:M15 family metallopeptidase n=1 Tax=Streptomyces hygroscopicus TaxID=1912 RepID=UPI00223E9DDB|nr:M15 family metallopeptidase [Streptomyces hygroscopicus]
MLDFSKIARRHVPKVTLVCCLVSTSACGAITEDKPAQHPEPRHTLAATKAQRPEADARILEVTPDQWRRMVAAGMVYKECPVSSRSQLRRVVMNHYGFDGKVKRGTLVVNTDVAESVARIFTILFNEKFPIRSMEPLEEFNGDDHASAKADNTSDFNCRRPDQINAPAPESPHANGRAIDVNPMENPWKDPRCGCWSPSGKFRQRKEGPGVILKGDLLWRTFVKEGWVWQDIRGVDYMHFDTGYPSKHYAGPPSRDK